MSSVLFLKKLLFNNTKSHLNEMPSSSCRSFLFDFTPWICARPKLITPLSVKGRMSHRGISVWVGCVRRLMQRSPRVASFFFFNPWWCHNQRLPEHKVHSQSPAPNTGNEHQTSCRHSNCSLRACESPLLLLFAGGIWSCVCVCSWTRVPV